MSRVIKFRAWDGASMHDHQLLSLSMQGGLSFDTGECGEKPLDWPLMQFTGLLDRNGKEIYEGDIVQWGENIETVAYNSENAAFEAETSMLDDSSFEVIGNIYESPDLLTHEE